MKRTLILILITFFFAISVVLALHIATPKKPNYKHASFDRVLVPEALQIVSTLDLKYNSYYIAGSDSSQIFLGNSLVPSHVVEINMNNLKDTVHHTIKTDSLSYRSVRVRVDAPYFYIVDGTIPFIYRGNITNWEAASYMDHTYFTDITPISAKSLILTGVNHDMKKTFYKVIEGDDQPKSFPYLLEAQGGESIFSTYGKLHYDKKNKRLTYVYLYRNQFLHMDTDLNLLYEGHTIDTISKIKFQVRKIISENEITTSTPPLTVNKKSDVSQNYLYINSNILARNEDIDTFENGSVIDVYDLEKGAYQFSFYIPNYKENTLKEFKLINNYMIANYNQHIITYKLNTNHLKPDISLTKNINVQ